MSNKPNSLLPKHPRQTKHFSELRLIGLWDANFLAKRLRINTFQCDCVFQHLKMKHCDLLVTKRSVMHCFSNFLNHDCDTSSCNAQRPSSGALRGFIAQRPLERSVRPRLTIEAPYRQRRLS
jgi:hypothetical protein